MSEWKPIDSAPKNIPILIYAKQFFFDEFPSVMCVAIRNKNNWWGCIGASGYECENDFSDPVYWMPLPEPPKC